ncbi:unnamed protein product, partial [Meganyctiphanes norvegica]
LPTTDRTRHWANDRIPNYRDAGFSNNRCVQTCQYLRIGGQCLWFSEPDFKLSWQNAESYCENMGIGAKLASLPDPYAVLYYVMGKFGDMRFWVGGTDAVRGGSWRWVNGQPISTDPGRFPWYPGTPSNRNPPEQCLEINYKGYYNDVTCWSRRPFICEVA